MAISVTNIGINSNTTGATVTLTAVTVPARSLIVVNVFENTVTATPGAVTDTVNTYSRPISGQTNGVGGICSLSYAANAALTSGTITYTKTTSGNPGAISAIYATGVRLASPLDAAVSATATGSSTTPTVTSGTPSRAGELFVSLVGYGNVTLTQDAGHGWTFPPNTTGASSSGTVAGGTLVNATASTKIFAPTFGTTSPWIVGVVGFFALTPPPQNPWQTGFINYAETPPWRAAPVDSNTLWMLTANVRPKNKQIWRYDYVPDPVWLADPTPTNIRTFPGVMPLPSPVVVPHAREDTIWQGAPVGTNIEAFPPAANPFSKLWRWDVVPDPVWLADPVPTNIETFPSAAAPFGKLWRWDVVPDPPWYAAPTPSDTLFQLTANGPPIRPRQWRWDHVPDPAWVWKAPPDWSQLLPSVNPFAKLWRYDYIPDSIWLGEPQSTNIATFPVVVPPAPGTPQTQFWAPSPPVRTEWQWDPPYNVQLFFTPSGAALSGATLGRLLVPPPDWTWTPPYNVQLFTPTAVNPFSKLWRWDFTPEPPWNASPRRSYTLFDLTVGGKPFFRQWRWDHVPDPVWLAEPQPTNIETLPVTGKPFGKLWRYDLIPDQLWQGAPVPANIEALPVTPTLMGAAGIILDVQFDFIWQGVPVGTNIETFPVTTKPFNKLWRWDQVPDPGWVWEAPPDWSLLIPSTAPFSKQWRWDQQPEPPWIGKPQASSTLPAFTAGGQPFGKQWRWDYQPEAPWVGAPVSVNIETFPAAGTPFSRLWRYDLTPSPDWTWQPPASGILQALTAGGAPTHLQWRYDYTPEPVWRGAPVSASYAALKESGKPFTIQWRYDWNSGQSWWQGAPIGVNVPIANPGPPIPVPPTTGTGGGERWPRTGYRWRWTDFNDRAWLKAFRDEFYRLRRLKNPERRRAQFEVLEQKFIGAAERALEYETPYEKKLDLVQLGEMLQGFAAPASFDRIEMYLVALAAEIDDEEAFLLLND